MTTIVAVRSEDRVYLGADARLCLGGSTHLGAGQPKIVDRTGPDGHKVTFGVSGRWRMVDLLRYFPVPQWPTQCSAHKWLVTELVPALRTWCDDHGELAKEEGRDNNGSDILVIARGHLFRMGPDWAIFEVAEPFAAAGSGEDLAMGAMHALLAREPEMPAEELLRAALDTACAFDLFSGGEPYIVSLGVL